MNVGIVLPYLKAGGTERQALYIARHLRDSGHNVTVVVAEATGAFRDEVDVETVSLEVPFTKLYIPLLIYRFAMLIHKRDFDVVLSRAWNMNMVTAIAGLVTQTQYVLFLSGATRRDGQIRAKLAIEGILLRRAARIISVSEAAKKNCIEVYDLPPSLVQVVHNGIEVGEVARRAEEKPEDVERIVEDEFNIVFVGRINHRKGVDILLRAVQGLEDEINVWIVGGGDINKYKALAKELGVEEKVFFLGEKENPFPELKRADLFVLPSRSEGFPNVLLEAMALGRPVLAANCETGPDEIIDGVNGRLFPVDDPHTLAQKIESLMRNEQVRIELGKKGKRTVQKHFNLESQLTTMEGILMQAASDSSG